MFYFINCTELDLGGWTNHDYNNTFKIDLTTDNCERISVDKVSPEEFIEKYEKLYKPVVITDICKDWKGTYSWTLDVSFINELF